MTNTIVLLSVLLQTNWQDTTVVHDGFQVQVGRRQTNYVIRTRTNYINYGGTIFPPLAYPILTSQPFSGPYNLVREVAKPNPSFIIISNLGQWPQWIWPTNLVITNDPPKPYSPLKPAIVYPPRAKDAI